MRLRLRTAAALAALLIARPTPAATFIWDGGGPNGNWSTPANWVGDVPPVGSVSTAIALSGAAQTATTQDVAGPFTLNSLTFAAGAGAFSVAGGPLAFAADGGAPPRITLDADSFASLTAGVRLGATVTVGGATAGTGGAGGYDLVAGGRVSGTGGLTVNYANPFVTAVLTGANNTYSGPTTVSSGVLVLGAVNTVGRQSAVTVNDALALAPSVGERGVTAGNYDQRVGSLAGGGAGFVDLGAARLTVGFAGAAADFAGTVGGAGGLVKVGTGTQTLTGANTFTGATLVEGGTLVLAGVAGRVAGPVSVSGPASLVLDSNTTGHNNDRLGDAAPVTLRGGFLTVFGNNAVTTQEATGPLVLPAGQSVIDVLPGANAGASLRFTGLSAAGTGTAVFTGGVNGLGATPGPGVANVLFSSAAGLLVGGNGLGPLTSVAPRFLATGSATGDALTPVTHGGNGVRPLTAAEFSADLAGTAPADAALNVRTTAANPAVAGPLTRNLLVLAADGQNLTVSGTLTLTSGVLLALPGTAGSQVGGPGPVAFGGGPAYVTVEGGTLAVATPLASAGLVKSGFGTLALASTAALGAVPVSVNAGTLSAAGPVPLQAVPVVRLAAGARLGVTGGFQLGAGQRLEGAGELIGPAAVAGVLDPTADPGPATLSAVGMSWLGGGRYDWRLNSALGGPFTQSLVSGAGALDLSALTPASRFTVRLVSLTADNEPGPVSDFDPSVPYRWPVAAFAGGVTGFDPAGFAVDASAFANWAGGGQFAVALQGNTLVVAFTPVPEPAGLLAVAGLAAVLRRLGRLLGRP